MSIAGSNSKVASDIFAQRAKLEKELAALGKECAVVKLQVEELQAVIVGLQNRLKEMEKETTDSGLGPGKHEYELEGIIKNRIEERDQLEIHESSLDERMKSIELRISKLASSGSATPPVATPARLKNPSSSNPREPPLEKTKIVKRPTQDHDQVRINYPLPPEILAGRKK
jgi:hypothetical protein